MMPPVRPVKRAAVWVFLERELAGGQTILSARTDVFSALAATPYDQVSVLVP